MKKILFLLMFFATTAQAGAFRIYTFNLQYQKITDFSNPLMPEIDNNQWGDTVSLNTGVDYYDVLYWDSRFHYESAFQKVMEVGWQFDIGLHLGKYIDFQYDHHSQHSADRENGYENVKKYYNYNAFGMVLKMIEEPRRRSSN